MAHAETFKALVIPVRVDGAPAPPSVESLQDWTFGANGSAAQVIDTASYGKVKIGGSVYAQGIRLRSSARSCNPGTMLERAVNAATRQADAELRRTRADFIVLSLPDLGCPWGGFAELGGPTLTGIGFIFQPPVDTDPVRAKLSMVRAISHEIGHLFGVLHAERLTCPGGVLRTNDCRVLGDGRDPYDMMGMQHPNRDLRYRYGMMLPNALERHWLTGARRPIDLPVVKKSGTYKLQNSSLHRSADGASMLRIPVRTLDPGNIKPKCGTLLLEYRSGTSGGIASWTGFGPFTDLFTASAPPSTGVLMRVTLPARDEGGDLLGRPRVRRDQSGEYVDYSRRAGDKPYCHQTGLIGADGRPGETFNYGLRAGQTWTDRRPNGTGATIEVLQLAPGVDAHVKITLKKMPPRPPRDPKPLPPGTVIIEEGGSSGGTQIL